MSELRYTKQDYAEVRVNAKGKITTETNCPALSAWLHKFVFYRHDKIDTTTFPHTRAPEEELLYEAILSRAVRPELVVFKIGGENLFARRQTIRRGVMSMRWSKNEDDFEVVYDKGGRSLAVVTMNTLSIRPIVPAPKHWISTLAHGEKTLIKMLDDDGVDTRTFSVYVKFDTEG